MRLLACYCFKDNTWQFAFPTGSFQRKLCCQDFSKISLITYFMLAGILCTWNEKEIRLLISNTFKV